MIEATGQVAASRTAHVARQLRAVTQKNYRYFGDFHLAAETGHAAGLPDAEEFVRNIKLSEQKQKEAFLLVEILFDAFTDFTHELLAYANTHSLGLDSLRELQAA